MHISHFTSHISHSTSHISHLTSAASAAANIAVALELQDRYAEAESWTAKAINLFSRIHTPDAAQQVVNLRYYQSQLHSRTLNKE